MLTSVARKSNVAPFLNAFTITMIVVLMAFFNYLLLESNNDKSGYTKLYLLMLVQLTPFLICFSRGHYNYIAFIMFNHFFTYSVAKFNQLKMLTHAAAIYPEALAAIDELTICSALTIASFYLSRQFLFYRFVEHEKFQMLTLSRTQLFVVAIYVICVPMFLDKIPAWLITLHFATMAADMVLLLCSTSPHNEKLAFYLRFGVSLSTAWYFLATGFLTMLGNLAGYIFIAACLQKNYKQLVLPLILAVVASLLQNVKSEYRTLIASNPNSTPIERVELIGNLLYAEYFEDLQLDEIEDTDTQEDKAVSESIFMGFSRIGDDSLERVLSWTPKRVPFWNGESYAAIPYLFIPRVLWNDKPSRHLWNKFGVVYGYLGANDNQTSVAVSYIAEAYMNFGYWGMYVFSLIFGLFAAMVERASFYFLGGYYFFTFMCFLMPMMSYGSDLTSIINSILIIMVALLLFRGQFKKMANKDEYS